MTARSVTDRFLRELEAVQLSGPRGFDGDAFLRRYFTASAADAADHLFTCFMGCGLSGLEDLVAANHRVSDEIAEHARTSCAGIGLPPLFVDEIGCLAQEAFVRRFAILIETASPGGRA